MKQWPHLFEKCFFPEMEQPEFQETWRLCTSILEIREFQEILNVQNTCLKKDGDLHVGDENDWVIPKSCTHK